MTSKKGIPRGWTWENGRGTGHLRHDGVAMNRCQWIKPVVWHVTTNEQQQTAKVRCYWAYYVANGKGDRLEAATLTIARGSKLNVEGGPWQVNPRAGENPLLAAIRWVRQQEKAAKKHGSR